MREVLVSLSSGVVDLRLPFRLFNLSTSIGRFVGENYFGVLSLRELGLCELSP